MTNSILVISLLGFVAVYGQTPCSHSSHAEPALSESTNLSPEYLPAAQSNNLDLSYLPPPSAGDSNLVPYANQQQLVYLEPPFHSQPGPLPKLQPLAEATSQRPVIQPIPTPVQPKIVHHQPLPQATYQRPVFQPLPSTVQPKLAPLPKLQPLPQATYQRPVYQALPSTVQPKLAPLPKLQPLPQATYQRPVYQALPSTVQPKLAPLPKLQTLPQVTYQRPVYQPLPSTAQPKLAPLPKLQPLPQATYQRPAIQPLPKLEPIVVQPFPALAPRPLAPLPKVVTPAPVFNKLPTFKPLSFPSPKQVVQPKISFQPKENEVQSTNTVGVKYDNQFLLKTITTSAQATNIQPKFVKPDLETAAQTNYADFRNAQAGQIKIHHYICDIGNEQQKFLCDLYRQWDLHHKQVSNDLDNPGDNSNNNPTFAKLPSSPRPVTYAPLPVYTTTTTQAPIQIEKDFENLPSQNNVNTIYLQPQPIYTTESTTVEIPKRVTPTVSNLITPEDSQTSVRYTVPPSTLPSSTTTTTTTTAAPTTGYDYPKPQPSAESSDLVPAAEGYEYPKPSASFDLPQKEGYDYPKPAIPFSDGASFSKVDSSVSSGPISSFNGLSSFAGPSSASFASPSPVNYVSGLTLDSSKTSGPISSFNGLSSFAGPSPVNYESGLTLDSSRTSLSSFSDRLSQYPFGYTFTSLADGKVYQPPAPPAVSTTLTPDIFLKSSGESIRYSFQPLQESVTTASPLQYNSQPGVQSVQTLAPLLLSKESLALTPPTSTIKNTEFSTTEAPFITSTYSLPTAGGFNGFIGQQQFYNPSPFVYNFQPFGSVPTASPLSYSFDSSLPVFRTNFSETNYQPLLGNSITSTESPVTYTSTTPSTTTTASSTDKSINDISTPAPLVTSTFAAPSAGSINSFSQFGQFGQFYNPITEKSINDISTQSPLVTSTYAAPSAGDINSFSQFGQFYNPVSPQYNFQPFQQSFTSASPLSYNLQSSGPSFQQLSPVNYNFQSLNQPIYTGESLSYQSNPNPSLSSGFYRTEFSGNLPSGPSSLQAGQTFSSSIPQTNNFQSGNGFFGGQLSSSSSSNSNTKSGLSFSNNVESVEHLKDLQATAKSLENNDLSISETSSFVGGGVNALNEAPRKQSSSTGNKDDISGDITLGNIEILKVKRNDKKKQ